MLNVVRLSNGWEVRVRPVPPTANFKWEATHIKLPKKPGKPVAVITSKLTGHTETPDALPESKEWNAWLAEMMLWEEEVENIQQSASSDEMHFAFDYACVDWRNPDQGVEEWIEDPPDGWEIPRALIKHEVENADSDMRMAFINYCLIEVPEDHNVIRRWMYPVGEDSTAPISESEVERVLASFQDGMASGWKLGGDLGSTARPGTRQTEVVGIRKRDVHSEGKKANTGWLVRLFKRLTHHNDGS